MLHRHRPADPADPTPASDLLSVARLQRSSCDDAARFAALASGAEPFPERRLRALVRRVERLCVDVREHHLAQEVTLWPLLEHCAPGATDLCGLRNDHTAMFSCLDSIRRATPSTVGSPDRRTGHRFASSLRELVALLEEHTVEEERETRTVLTTAVPRGRWREVEPALLRARTRRWRALARR